MKLLRLALMALGALTAAFWAGILAIGWLSARDLAPQPDISDDLDTTYYDPHLEHETNPVRTYHFDPTTGSTYDTSPWVCRRCGADHGIYACPFASVGVL